MLPTQHFLAFFLTVSALILIPGPSVLFVVRRGIALGRRAPLLTVLGNSCGFAVLLVAVALGIGAIVARSDAVFTTLKLIGAAYLVLLGIRNIRDRKALGTLVSARVEPKPRRRGGAAARRVAWPPRQTFSTPLSKSPPLRRRRR